jgi:hypothetical protein
MPRDLLGREIMMAAQLEQMAPEQRQQHFEDSIVRDPRVLPQGYLEGLRARAEATIARRDAEQAAAQRDMPNAS